MKQKTTTQGKYILIGVGISTLGAAKLLTAEGSQVIILEKKFGNILCHTGKNL